MSAANHPTFDPIPGRPTVAEVDLDILRANFRAIRDFVGTEAHFMAVVKANAYGHGAAECSRSLEMERVDWFGVALVEEALELRRAGISTPILCFGGVWPGQEGAAIEHNITPVVLTAEMAERLETAARSFGRDLVIHIKVDTGMGRIGIPISQMDAFVGRLSAFTRLRIDGVMTHLSSADDLSASEFTLSQIDAFHHAVKRVRAGGHDPTYLSIANSPGAVAFSEARGNMVRIGGILYGLGGDVLPAGIPAPHLAPVLSLRTRVAFVKDVPTNTPLGYGRTHITKRPSKIATIPIGYNDGYPRALSNLGEALILGRRVPVIGRVSMDWTMLDVTDVGGVELGDEAVLIGKNGPERILAEDLARHAGTISYEITCGIGPRIPRIYLNVS